LNIMMMNEKATPKASHGICLVLRLPSTFLDARNHKGIMMTKKKTHVSGPRYPSGMCTTHARRCDGIKIFVVGNTNLVYSLLE